MAAIIRSRTPPLVDGGGGLVVALDHAPPLLEAVARALRRASTPAAAAVAAIVRPWLGDGRDGCAEYAPFDAIVLGAGAAAVWGMIDAAFVSPS